MTGIVDLAYTLLLGWVRLVFDWIWKIVAGEGAGAPLQWFLQNWKVWFVIIVVAGLAADWLMWIVRWRPYRLLMSKLRKKTPAEELAVEAAWDDDTGYYDTETPLVEESADAWNNLSPLSEIHPDWADNLAVSDQDGYAEPAPAVAPGYDDGAYYTEAYEEPEIGAQPGGYWDETPDESAYEPEPAYEAPSSDTAVYMPPPEQPEIEQTMQYGRPGNWPGAFPFQALQQNTEPEPEEDDYIYEQSFHDYLREDDPPPPQRFVDPSAAFDDSSRRRRSLRGSAEDIREYEAAFAPKPAPPPADTRPARLVRPDPAPYTPPTADGFRTVTGKPIKRRGFFTDTDEEPIAGLPPLRRENPFISHAEPEPYGPDFDEDE